MFLTVNNDKLKDLKYKLLIDLDINESILSRYGSSNIEIENVKREIGFSSWSSVFKYKQKGFKIIE